MKIHLNKINYKYNEGTPSEVHALKDINLEIDSNDFIGLIGHTGSGKSTLVQHLNGLYKPTSGSILLDGENLEEKDNLHLFRQKVGLVFQYPEHQLFEETVYKDIAFGPQNMDLPDGEVDRRVRDSIRRVGLNFEEFKDKSPFELSGGQKRRVAIAGVLSMQPNFLVLDEPTAGLDPEGTQEISDIITVLHKKYGVGIVLVSHSMESIAKLANRILVMDQGQIVMDGSPKEVFSQKEKLESMGLGIPEITKFALSLSGKYPGLNSQALTVEEAYRDIESYFRGEAYV